MLRNKARKTIQRKSNNVLNQDGNSEKNKREKKAKGDFQKQNRELRRRRVNIPKLQSISTVLEIYTLSH